MVIGRGAGCAWRWLALPAALLIATLASAKVAIPPLKARVTDLTGTLSADQRTALEQMLAAFEARKGAQIAVLMLPSTQPETVAQYAVRVEETWKLGRKGIDDGVLLVVAKDDRKLWIEVGYGLEGPLPDAIAKRIIEEEIVPHFKQGDYYGGISAGVQRVIKVVDGEPLPAPRQRATPDHGWDWSSLAFFGLFLVFIVGGVLRAMFGRLAGAGILGGVAGLIGWLLAGTVAIALIAAIIVFLFSLFGGVPGRWSSGGYGGGGFGGGGFGDGGFSGGGGSSGGGGAGGSW